MLRLLCFVLNTLSIYALNLICCRCNAEHFDAAQPLIPTWQMTLEVKVFCLDQKVIFRQFFGCFPFGGTQLLLFSYNV